jgi:predicted solute-binding protein
MADDARTLRLGYHNRANLLPLLYPLEAGWSGAESPWVLEVVHSTPLRLLDDLLAGNLDAAFVTPAGAQTHGGKIAPLGGWGLAAQGTVETALLLSPQRIDLLHEGEIAITPEAKGSTAEHLLKTLREPYYGIEVNLLEPDSVNYNEKGARLMFGDTAMKQAQANPKDWVADDLGLAWWVLTGVLMVWDILCVPRGLEERKPGAGEAIQAAIRLSQRTAREQQANVLAEGTRRLNMKQERVKDLFGRQTYTLGHEEQKGLARFLDMAGRAKAI